MIKHYNRFFYRLKVTPINLRKNLPLNVIVFALLFCVKNAGATSYTWNGGSSGSWTTSSNWLPNTGYPGSSGTTDVAIINTSNATVNLNGNLTISQLESTNYGVAGITINFTGTTPTLAITGGLSMAQPSSFSTVLTFSGTGIATISGTSTFSYGSSFTIASGCTVTFAASSTLDWTATQGVITNSGTLNFTSSTLKLGSSTSFVSPGTVIANSENFNITGTPAFITYGGKFVANSCTFTLPSSGYLKSTSSSSAFTATTCTFNISGSGGAAYIYNNGTFVDHGSTYNVTGQGSYIQNTGTGSSMHLRGTTVNLGPTIAGNNSQYISSSSTFTADSGSTINALSQSSYINNSGTFYAGTSGSSCVITLSGQGAYITNTSIFDLGSTSIIYPSSYQALITNTKPGIFTLQSDANGSAAFGVLSSTAIIKGTFNVERYFQGGATKAGGRWVYRNYRIISSPVNDTTVNGNYIWGLNYIVGSTVGQTTLANSATNAFVKGANGGSTASGNPTLFLYRENKVPSNATFTSGNFIGITDITSPSSLSTTDPGPWTIPIGNGVFFFFRGNASNYAAKTTSPYVAPESTTLTSTGNINQQQVTVKDWFTPALATLSYTTGIANATVRGFNMVGNPYPSSIDWNSSYANTGITRTHVNPTIWVFDPVTDQYDTYITTSPSAGIATGNASNIIASGQGFFVQDSIANSSLVFNEACKYSTWQLTGSNLLMGTPAGQNTVQQMLRLKLVADSLDADDIVIWFNSNATAKYSGREDAMYIQGSGALEGLSSFSADSIPLAINCLPLPKQTQQIIRLNVTAAQSGIYTFQRTELTAIPQIYNIWLIDKYKKDSLDIRNNTTYAFNLDLTDTASFGSSRFQIVIRQDPSLAVHLLNFTATKTPNGAQVIWKTENEQNYTYFTVERSTDNGTTFNALSGFTSYSAGTYSLFDRYPFPIGASTAIDKYRLKIEDINGTISYSEAITLTYSLSGGDSVSNNLIVYPNPATSFINLTINPNTVSLTSNLSTLQTVSTTPAISKTTGSPNYGIKIINMAGAVVKSATTPTSDWQDNVSNFLPGTYIIQVVDSSNNSVVGKATFVKL